MMMTYGEKIRFEAQEYFGMPAPERLVDIGDVGLREIGVSRQKSRYLIEMARGVAKGRLNIGAFHSVSCEEAIDQLMEIPGVGRWTAEIVAMRGLGFQDVFPAGDLGLQKAVQRTFGMDHRPSEGALRKLSNRWKGYRSYAALYLWMTLVEDGYA
jgi:DNA-3-methyladenine glycosylase II